MIFVRYVFLLVAIGLLTWFVSWLQGESFDTGLYTGMIACAALWGALQNDRS